MPTLGEVLPAQELDAMLQQVAPADLTNEELVQFKRYLSRQDVRSLQSVESDLKAAARIRGRKIILREQLLSRLGTDWLRKQHEVVEGELAKIEIAKDIADLNVMELDLAGQMWNIGKSTNVLRLDEQASSNPLIEMIKRRETETDKDILEAGGPVDDDALDKMFGQ